MKYRPVPTPAPSQQYLEAELRRLQQTTELASAVTLTELNAAPERITDGQIVYADGSNWNPGDGENVYARVNGAWQSLGGGLNGDVNETITGDWTFSGTALFTTRPQIETGVFGLHPDGGTASLNPSLTYVEADHGIGVTTTASATETLGYHLFMSDGTINARAGFWIDGTKQEWGLSESYTSNGLYDFVITAGSGNASFRIDFTSTLTTISTDLTLADTYKLRIVDDTDVSSSSTEHPFQIGNSAALNMRFDNNEIMVVSNGAANTLQLQADGGSVYINENTQGGFYLRRNSIFRQYGPSNVNYTEMQTSSGFTTWDNDNSGTRVWRWYNYDQIYMQDGCNLYIFETADSDYLRLNHDGTRGIIRDKSGSAGIHLRGGDSVASSICIGVTVTIADDGTHEFTHNGTGYTMWIVGNSFNDNTQAIIAAAGSNAYLLAGSTAGFISLGETGSNPDVDGDANFWTDGAGNLHVKNRLGSSRRFSAFAFSF